MHVNLLTPGLGTLSVSIPSGCIVLCICLLLNPPCRENTPAYHTYDTVGAREFAVGDYVAMETNPAYIANEQVWRPTSLNEVVDDYI